MSPHSDEHDDIELTGEDNIEEASLEDIEQSAGQKLQSLKKKLAACEAKNKLLHEDLQRQKADFLNARKRIEAQASDMTERAVDDFIARLIPLYDSFAMAMANTDAWEKVDETWRKGIEGIQKELQSIFSSFGVSTIHPLKKPFDHELHEAVDRELVSSEEEHDTVTAVLQDGFVRNENGRKIIIRPARVRVGEFSKN